MLKTKKKTKNRMANSVDPDEMAHYEPSHLDLHCMHKHLNWSTGLKRLRGIDSLSEETILVKIVLPPSKKSLL